MNYYEQHHQDYLEGLKTFLRIPSISTLSEHKPDIRRAAEFVRSELEKAGLHRRADRRRGQSAGLRRVAGRARQTDLLFYGHYDVQPPDPLDEWKSPPFEPDIRGNNIYARGAADDKGQIYILIKAVEGLLKQHGRLPVNVKFLIEGEEEIGGEHIESYVASKPARIKADAAVICDTEMFAPELPTICVGLRGMVYGELIVQGARPRSALRRLRRRGAQSDPGDRRNSLRAEGSRGPHPHSRLLRSRRSRPAQKERDGVGAAAVRREGVHRKGNGRQRAGGRAGGAAVRASLGAPHSRSARHSRRLHRRRREDRDSRARGGQDQHAPGCRPASRRSDGADPESRRGRLPQRRDRRIQADALRAAVAGESRQPFIQAAAEAMKQVFGKETVYIRSGGSIPIVAVFDEYLGIPSVMMGFGLPDDNLHAPNEKIHLPNFFRGIEAVARYLEILGG